MDHATDADPLPVAAALAVLDDDHLHALIATANGGPQTAPGLLAWLEHAADWELHRRGGLVFPLQPPAAAIDPSEDAASIEAANMLRAQFAPVVPTVAALFAAIVGTLTGNATRH